MIKTDLVQEKVVFVLLELIEYIWYAPAHLFLLNICILEPLREQSRLMSSLQSSVNVINTHSYCNKMYKMSLPKKEEGKITSRKSFSWMVFEKFLSCKAKCRVQIV